MRVLALDPGERVGWARAVVADDGTWSDLRHGITPLREMALAVAERMDIAAGYNGYDDGYGPRPDYDLIVMEEWRLYPEKAREFIGSSFPSVQFVGMVKLCCWLSGTKLVMQGAGVKKTADKTLAALWPEMHQKVTRSIRHDDGHDLDALRHLWFWTFKNTTISRPIQSSEAA